MLFEILAAEAQRSPDAQVWKASIACEIVDRRHRQPEKIRDLVRREQLVVEIANGGLRASKAGPRRWMVRRADLAAFLNSAAPDAIEPQVSEDTIVPLPSGGARVSLERAQEQLELAEGRWEDAIREHVQPPPDAGFGRRLRALADAAAQEQAAYRYAADEGFGWRSGPAWLPPRELRPAPWRDTLAASETWERFDDAVEGLSRARTGLSVAAIARAFGELSAAAWELADAVERTRQLARAAGAS